jgi:FkbM family methyltransferase
MTFPTGAVAEVVVSSWRRLLRLSYQARRGAPGATTTPEARLNERRREGPAMRSAWFATQKHKARLQLRRRLGIEVVRVASDARDAETLLGLRLDQLFSTYGVELVLDVGAQVGNYAAFLRENGYAGRIISFEPVAPTYEILAQRAASDPHWQAVNLALGSQDGEAELNVTKSTVFSSFLTPNAYALEEWAGGAVIDHVERVTVRRLDRVLPELIGSEAVPPTFLKMDTQGWDLEVLRGASGVIGDIIAIQSEVSVLPIYGRMPNLQESLDAFRALGFAIAGLFPVGYDSNNRVVEFDCVCIADPGAGRAAMPHRGGSSGGPPHEA